MPKISNATFHGKLGTEYAFEVYPIGTLTADGSVITIGVHRGRRYRLTDLRLTKALNIAKELIATVP